MPGCWELQPNVMVWTLHTDTVTFEWANSLRRLQIPGIFQDVFPMTGSPFDHARNQCCDAVMASGADYLFFLDSDVRPPPDTIWRLIRHNKPLVSGMYCRRSPPHSVPVAQKNGTWLSNFRPGDLVEVDLIGAGCMLIRRDLLEQLKPQRPECGKKWFDWRVDMKDMPEPKLPSLSEDFTFCVAAKQQLGIPTLLDTSIRCRHVGYFETDLGTVAPLGSMPPP